MQKFLWVLAVGVVCLGVYLIWHNQNPEPCSERGVQKFMQEKMGAIPTLKSSPQKLQRVRLYYLKKHGCDVEQYNTVNGKKLPLPHRR